MILEVLLDSSSVLDIALLVFLLLGPVFHTFTVVVFCLSTPNVKFGLVKNLCKNKSLKLN